MSRLGRKRPPPENAGPAGARRLSIGTGFPRVKVRLPAALFSPGRWKERFRRWRHRRVSLRKRLRISIIALVTVMVTVQFLATLRVTAEADFRQALQRSESIASQVSNLLADRLAQEVRLADPPPADLDATIELWTRAVASDPSISELLARLLATADVAVEIQVCDRLGRILASSNPSSARLTYRSLPDFAQWNVRPLWDRLFEVMASTREYCVTVPLGIQGMERPLFTIRVIISSVLLRNALMPQVNSLALTSALSLLAAMMLAVLFSNMVLRALNRLAERIDYLTAGDFASATATSGRESEEIAAVSSKLNLLSEQFRDALQLRGNLNQLLASLEAAVLMFDPDRRLVLAGQPAERILGRRREEMIGRELSEIFPPDTGLGAAIEAALERRTPFRDRPAIIERPGLPPARLLVSVELLENLPGLHQLGTLITLRDVESRRRLQSQIDVSTRLTAIGRLTGGVAHEIKNPLNAIALHLEILKAKLAGVNTVSPELDVIEREIGRLDRVVKTFLDFTRPVELKLSSVNFTELVREVTVLVTPEAKKAGVQIDFQADGGPTMVEADQDLLKQAVLNVVMNGIEAMPKGGRLELRLRRGSEDHELLVTDQGPGIPEELRDKIFNLYFTTKPGGTGIGLAMTFRVIHLHNGTIDFTSEVGRGTTFRIRVPAAEEVTAQEPADRAASTEQPRMERA